MEQLTMKLLPPKEPKEIGDDEGWKEVLQKILYLPKDYIDFIKIYGTGCINNFIWILNPFAQNPYLNLLEKMPIIINSIQESSSHVAKRYTFYPSENGIFPLGITDNGDCFFYRVEKGTLTETIIVMDGRLWEIEVYEMSFSEFLLKFINNQIKSEIFPTSIAELKTSFQ